MKRVLIISYAFPPLNVAGTFRPLRFVKYIKRFGWEVSVVTVRGRDDLSHDESLLSEVPPDASVYHAGEIDPFAFFRRKISNSKSAILSQRTKQRMIGILDDIKPLVSIPDIQLYWVIPVILKGITLMKNEPYDVILTTSPPPSTHLAGWFLSSFFDKPLVADFRDPWVDSFYFHTRNGALRKNVERWMEGLVINRARFVLANTDRNWELFRKRYPQSSVRDKFVTLTNGFDKELIDSVKPKNFGRFTICHTGVMYSDLDPYYFFQVLSRWLTMHNEGEDFRKSVQVLLLGTQDNKIKQIVHDLNLDDCVHIYPRVGRLEALAYMKGADLLLVNLGFKETISSTIPGKLYDYLGAEKPILGFLPAKGSASEIVRKTNTGTVVSIHDDRLAVEVLDRYYECHRNKDISNIYNPEKQLIERFEALSLTEQLAGILDDAARMQIP